MFFDTPNLDERCRCGHARIEHEGNSGECRACREPIVCLAFRPSSGSEGSAPRRHTYRLDPFGAVPVYRCTVCRHAIARLDLECLVDTPDPDASARGSGGSVDE